MEFTLPEQFEEFADARKAGFLRVKGLKEQGHKVAGIFCTFTPTEILDAAGFVSVSLCGMSDETIPAAESHLPKNMCPLIKSSYGFALTDKCPYTYFSDLIVGETTCDGKKKMYEMLNDIKPTYILHLPQGYDSDPVTVWTAELRRFIRYLEEHFDVTITDEMLREAARKRNEQRRTHLKLMELQKQTPPPLGGMQMYATMEGVGFVFTHEERVAKLNALRESVEANADKSAFAGAKRIMVTGCPIGGVLGKTVKAIEASGGVVVCFENCSGIKAAYQMVDTEAEDIVKAIAERYLQIGCSVMTPNQERMKMIPKFVEEFKVDGIVEVDLQACTPYCVETFKVKQLADSLGIPYLAVETDYSQSDSGQLATRMEAFLEMLYKPSDRLRNCPEPVS